MHKNDALLHLLWSIAQVGIKAGVVSKYGNATQEENNYLNLVLENEKIKISWDDFAEVRKSLGYSTERIIDEACKALRVCGKDWQIKCVGYMHQMAWISEEDNSGNNNSVGEWALILRVQKELGLTDEERKISFKNLPSGK